MADLLERLKAALADRYNIERELGSGGMATVYLAQDLKHERQVAVKVLRPELAAALGPERFLQEIKIAANLHHPHILPLYDSGEADGRGRQPAGTSRRPKTGPHWGPLDSRSSGRVRPDGASRVSTRSRYQSLKLVRG